LGHLHWTLNELYSSRMHALPWIVFAPSPNLSSHLEYTRKILENDSRIFFSVNLGRRRETIPAKLWLWVPSLEACYFRGSTFSNSILILNFLSSNNFNVCLVAYVSFFPPLGRRLWLFFFTRRLWLFIYIIYK
jgi:hypothetical protein